KPGERDRTPGLPLRNPNFKLHRPDSSSPPPKVSLFLPVYNEEENLTAMHQKITASLEQLGHSYEVIYVDDGSTDGSLALLTSFAATDARVRVISFRRNCGQPAAVAAGVGAAPGGSV